MLTLLQIPKENAVVLASGSFYVDAILSYASGNLYVNRKHCLCDRFPFLLIQISASVQSLEFH